jgi:hypothetical protein
VVHVSGISVGERGSGLVCGALRLQAVHWAMASSTALSIPGNQTLDLSRRFVLTRPWCPVVSSWGVKTKGLAISDL